MTKDDLLDMPEVDVLLRAICSLENPDEARALMLDLATPREIAEWVYFVGVTNRFMTGQSILVDGGEAGNAQFVWPDVEVGHKPAEG